MILNCEKAGLLACALSDSPARLDPARVLLEAGSFSAYCANEKTLFYGTKDGFVRSVSLEEGKEDDRAEIAKVEGKVTSLTVTPDGALLTWGTDDGTIKLFRMTEKKIIADLEVCEETEIAGLLIS